MWISCSSIRSATIVAGYTLLVGCASDSPSHTMRIFATSTQYDGNLGGLSGADAKCDAVAQGAALGGSWKAWLSDSGNNGLDRIQEAGPWYRVDGLTLVANNKVTLTTTLINPIATDERGLALAGNTVWTGTKPDGTKDIYTCSNWSNNTGMGNSSTDDQLGTYGDVSQAGSAWTTGGGGLAGPCPFTCFDCRTMAHLVCIEQ